MAALCVCMLVLRRNMSTSSNLVYKSRTCFNKKNPLTLSTKYELYTIKIIPFNSSLDYDSNGTIFLGQGLYSELHIYLFKKTFFRINNHCLGKKKLICM